MINHKKTQKGLDFLEELEEKAKKEQAMLGTRKLVAVAVQVCTKGVFIYQPTELIREEMAVLFEGMTFPIHPKILVVLLPQRYIFPHLVVVSFLWNYGGINLLLF